MTPTSHLRLLAVAGACALTLSLGLLPSAASEDQPFPFPSGFYQGTHEKEANPAYFHFESIDGNPHVSVSSAHYYCLPSPAVANETQYEVPRLRFHNPIGVTIGIGQAATYLSLRQSGGSLVALLRGRAPYGDRTWALEPLTGDRGDILELNHRADAQIEQDDLESVMKLFTDQGRGARAGTKEDQQKLIAERRASFPAEYDQGRMYRGIFVSDSRAFVDTQHVRSVPRRTDPWWELQFLSKVDEQWRFAAKERVAGHLMQHIGPQGFARPGAPLHIPRIEGWNMYILEALREDGRPFYMFGQFSPQVDAALSVVLQKIPSTTETLEMEPFVSTYHEALQEHYSEFEEEAGESREIGGHVFHVVPCRYRMWFGKAQSLRYYTVTENHIVIIALNVWKDDVFEERVKEAEAALSRLSVT